MIYLDKFRLPRDCNIIQMDPYLFVDENENEITQLLSDHVFVVETTVDRYIKVEDIERPVISLKNIHLIPSRDLSFSDPHFPPTIIRLKEKTMTVSDKYSLFVEETKGSKYWILKTNTHLNGPAFQESFLLLRQSKFSNEPSFQLAEKILLEHQLRVQHKKMKKHQELYDVLSNYKEFRMPSDVKTIEEFIEAFKHKYEHERHSFDELSENKKLRS